MIASKKPVLAGWAPIRVRRTELKYQISSLEAEVLKSRLAKVLRRDRFNPEGAYFIRSLYFDSKSNICFTDKAGGFLDRRKFRIRFYDFSSKNVKFEIKHRVGDMVHKETATLSRFDAEALAAGDTRCLLENDDPVLRKAYYDFKRDYYVPVVIVDYMREAFTLDFNNIRITFDSLMKKSDAVARFNDAKLLTVPAQEPCFTIMEIKYDHFFPKWVDGLLQGVRAQRCANSKYCLSRMF